MQLEAQEASFVHFNSLPYIILPLHCETDLPF